MSGSVQQDGRGIAYPPWLIDGVSEAARRSVRAHPSFIHAMHRSAAGVVELYAGNHLLNRVLNDRGRTLFGFFALYLDALPDAAGARLTVGRMTALCAETGMCSRGRAKAMLALLRWGGYLAPGPAAGDRRVKPLVPTERMRTLHRERWRRQYRAIALVEPRALKVLDALDDPAFVARLTVAFGTGHRCGYRVLHHAPAFAPFADRDSGALVFFSLLAAEAGGEPPSISELARRFHVSRAHVLQMLKEAEAEGLVARGEGGGAGRLTPKGLAALADFFAATFAVLICSADRALSGDLADWSLPCTWAPEG